MKLARMYIRCGPWEFPIGGREIGSDPYVGENYPIWRFRRHRDRLLQLQRAPAMGGKRLEPRPELDGVIFTERAA